MLKYTIAYLDKTCMRGIIPILFLVTPGLGLAGQVYKCETADGSTRYQDTPCATTEQESQPEIVDNALDSSGDQKLIRQQNAQETAEATHDTLEEADSPEPVEKQYYSYRCSAEGEIWYRHNGCPSEIEVADRVPYGDDNDGAYNITKGEMVPGSMEGKLYRNVQVQGSQVSRSQACDAIQHPGDRKGADRDSEYSTYRRNKGTDPCSPKYLSR